jgi:hypothetical protein
MVRVARRTTILRLLRGTSAMIAMMASSCVRPPYDPFKTSSSEVRERVRTIAIAPLLVAATLADREAVRAQLEPAVTARLEAGGFTVVPSTEMERLWRRAADDVGDVFDPVTGALDKAQFKTVEAAVYRDLRSERNVDAVLYLGINAVVLYLPPATVAYCGTTVPEPLYWPATAPPLRGAATVAVVLCLNAELADLEGRELYGIRHGLEPIETYAAQTRAVRPFNERLEQPARLVEAVDVTVGPLAGAGRN